MSQAVATRPDRHAVIGVVAISTFTIGLGSAIGFTFGYVATLLIEDLNLTRAAVGALTSVYFGSTGVGSVAGGLITDRVGARRAVALDMLLVVVAAAAIVVFRSYPVLLLASVLAGAGYSLSNAGTNVAIAAVVPARQRAMAMTIKTAGVPAMGAVAAFAGPWAGERYGWSIVMGTIGALALLSLIATLVVLPDDRGSLVRSAPRQPLPPGFLWFPLGSFFLIGGSQPLYSWVVPFFEESVGTSLAAAGRISSGASVVAVAAMLLVARRSDIVGPARRVPMMVALTLASLLGVVITATATTAGPWVGAPGVMIGTGAQLAAIGLLHAAIVDRVPGAVGRASGVTMTGYYLGALASPVSFGWMVDRTGGYTFAWVVMMVTLAAAAVCYWQGHRRVPPVLQEV